ncbi:hypothetical protein UFOVP504_1 [uncultured Caudovirales phage]|uniref:Uncharacterized protein n=1 Tax=uncultured Caudovirales phage TaxID=2100421 RepID=A0A6J5MKV0_9CAUD|nr:hypothetical protein UFOVP504_1 [uncultured Caudovirales phage]CAB4178256.1 hypothetical protein UFOVP1011_49 [uncultured Caudovirales phage]CAB4187090.1 hypothetical protein UFOVP1162_15 [uncultured Caudovirales phage]CAB4218461.1 hypothetical protein UFOVP1611_18 [uncultured Caudovirales phage]
MSDHIPDPGKMVSARDLAPVIPPAVVAALVEALEAIAENQVYLSSAGTRARAALALYREAGR